MAVPEAVARWTSAKKVLLKISQKSQQNACARLCFLIKLQKVKRVKKVLKRDSDTGVFL